MEPVPGTPVAAQSKRANAAAAAPRASRWQRLLGWIVIAYVASIVVLWAWMYRDGDRLWLATLVLFGPRWLCSLPLPFLALAAAVWRRRLLVPLAAAAIVIVFPMMGFQVHLSASAPARPALKVLTCNVEEKVFRPSSLAAVIAEEEPDVVALQEVREGTRFIWPPAWHVVERDEFILASRWPIAERQRVARPGRPDFAAIRYTVQSPDREIQIFNLHLSTPRPGLEAVLSRKTLIDPSGAGQMEAVLRRRAAECAQTSDWIARFPGPKIVVGDFNMPSDSTLFRRCWSSSLTDAFSAVGWGFGFTKISEKGGWSYGARIDHVLFSTPWHCVRCWVGPDIGSDHLPLLAEFE